MFAELRTVPVKVRIHKLELESDGEDVSHIEKAYEGKVITLNVDTTSRLIPPPDEEIAEELEDYLAEETSWLVASVTYDVLHN